MEILILCLVMFVGVVYGYYTVDGSGIAEHPYHDVYGGARRLRTGLGLRPRRDRRHAELVARHALNAGLESGRGRAWLRLVA